MHEEEEAASIEWIADRTYKVISEAKFQENYSEICLSRLITTHKGLALTAGLAATGSPIAGLAFWEDPGGKITWAVLTGISALASYILGFSAMPERIKKDEQARQTFMDLRMRAERLYHDLSAPSALNPGEDGASEEINALRRNLDNAVATKHYHAFDLVLLGAMTRAKAQLTQWLTEQGYSR